MKRIFPSSVLLGLVLLAPSLHADPASEIEKLGADIKTLDSSIQTTSDKTAKVPLYTERSKTLRLRALELEKLNRYQEAIDDYIRCFEDTEQLSGQVRNRQAEMLTRVAYCQLKIGKYELAKENMYSARKASGWLPNEPFYLKNSVKVRLANEEFEAAIKDCIALREATKSVVEKQNSYIMEATAMYLRGDYSGALFMWRNMAGFNPKLAEFEMFDPLQAPFNAAVNQSPNDVAARIKRAHFFRDRANQKRFPNFYEAKSPLTQGGLTNLIDPEVLDVQNHSFYQSAYYDWTKAIALKKEPSYYAERALVGALFNQVAPAYLKIETKKINDDLNYAQSNGTKDGETLRALGRFYDEAAPDTDKDSQWRPMLVRAINYYSRALIQDPTYTENDKIREARSTKIGFYLSGKSVESPNPKPTTALQWKEWGNSLFAKDQLSAALDAYNQAINVDAKFADAYNNKGNIYNRIGAYDLAIKEYDTAITTDPKHRVAYLNRSKLWQTLDDSPKAFADASKAIQFAVTPAQKADALNQRAELYFNSQRYPLALTDVTNLLTIDPKNAAAWTFRGQIEILNKKLPAALTSLQKATSLDANVRNGAVLLATAQHLNGALAPLKLEGKKEDIQWLSRFLRSKQFNEIYSSDEEKARIQTLVELAK